MIWHASRRHTYIYIYMERVVSFPSPARSPLLLYCNDNSARDGGRDAVNIEYRCEVKKKKKKGIVGIVGEGGNNGEGASSWNEERQLPKGAKLVATRVWKGQVSSTKVSTTNPPPRRPIFTARPFPSIPLLNFH